MREGSDSTAVQVSLEETADTEAQACAGLAPELRTQLQICMTSVETPAALDLPLEAHSCAASIERVLGVLVRDLTSSSRSIRGTAP